MKNSLVENAQAPSLIKLGACFIYESLIILAISFACTLPYLMLVGDASHGIRRFCLQLFLWLCVGAYFVWCWNKKGQTLAMQTWQVKVVNQQKKLLSVRMAILRYLLASVSLFLLGLGFLWAFIDADHLFAHDRLLKNKLIYYPQNYRRSAK